MVSQVSSQAEVTHIPLMHFNATSLSKSPHLLSEVAEAVAFPKTWKHLPHW